MRLRVRVVRISVTIESAKGRRIKRPKFSSSGGLTSHTAIVACLLSWHYLSRQTVENGFVMRGSRWNRISERKHEMIAIRHAQAHDDRKTLNTRLTSIL